jgi:hypothetical protein
MSDQMLVEPVELTDAELDFVTGGQALAAGGLVNLALSDIQIDVLRNADIDVIDDVTVTIRDVANNNKIGVGVVIAALGGAAGLIQRA